MTKEFLSKEDFITEHLKTCTAKRCKKYDPAKPSGALHSLMYSRRKCAKQIWRKRKLQLENKGEL